MARGWERREPEIQRGLAAVDTVLLRVLELEPGHRVVDLGCGTGDPTFALARWVGPRGLVVGVDIAPAMLAVARRRARLLGLRQVRFRTGDLGRLKIRGPRFDRAVSRFGLMFVDDPARALEGVRAALRPRGRFAAAVWGPLERNPANQMRAEILPPFLDAPPPDPETVPHPMRFARPGRLARLMRAAGFQRVHAEEVTVDWCYRSLEEFVDSQIETSLAETHAALPPRRRRDLRQRLTRASRPFVAHGMVRFTGMAWVVSGQRS